MDNDFKYVVWRVKMDKKFEIMKKASLEHGCYVPEPHIFHQKRANVPMYLRAYWMAKGEAQAKLEAIREFEGIVLRQISSADKSAKITIIRLIDKFQEELQGDTEKPKVSGISRTKKVLQEEG